ncbi:hypothetical protein KA075_02550 [Candidatus Saccharibacteria bacterium]|nr:hypothetical protein [Candidatus Saccharibacteria bacterium]
MKNHAPTTMSSQEQGGWLASPLAVADRLAQAALAEGIMLPGHVPMPHNKEDPTGGTRDALRPVGVESPFEPGTDAAVAEARARGINSGTDPNSTRAEQYRQDVAATVNVARAAERFGDDRDAELGHIMKARAFAAAEAALRSGEGTDENMYALGEPVVRRLNLPKDTKAQIDAHFA